MVSMILASSWFSGSVAAIPEYSKDIPSSLKNNCKVCHERASGGPINSFGKDYVMHITDMEALSRLDSDDDGYTNGDELEAGSLPGNPGSTPTNRRKNFNWVYILGSVSILLIVGGLYLRMRRG